MKFFLVYLLFTSLFLSCGYDSKIREAYYIPSGYTGVTYVVFNKKIKTSSPSNDTYREYYIPQNGLKMTDFPPRTGPLPTDSLKYWTHFYYVSKEGVETSLLNYKWIEDEYSPHQDSVYVFWSMDSHKNYGDKNFVQSFIVDTLKNLKNYQGKYLYHRTDSLLNEDM